MDRLSPDRRSWLMSRVASKNTTPEMVVRRLLHGLGYRYRLHTRDLPGRPDLVFKSKKKAIFVHGCFWHRHSGCRKATNPKTSIEFWQKKFERNVQRDAQVVEQLQTNDWQVLTVWQCETKDLPTLKLKLQAFLA
ncbi:MULTISPECIES: very short patch repair endonuclease [unclassified Bosea (in: a-proteobacteria)]|nr:MULTISPECIES: very short patch repair endonuclease [unclassified Bosea (in: a-proteobacteria)]RXT19407.1 very short patch repair endonuclease [Bosea sp. Tri-39]RXT41680.1 very short patch repair endonuclease [Bosea sp. Tri-54]